MSLKANFMVSGFIQLRSDLRTADQKHGDKGLLM